ncbi:GyrI-like domain-containing protein [Paenibacillus sp. GYB004]|uniref:GyrI-like domain-containing protein n=1 Tax=Paenibacillus sp. GYB004 TaxID=2994393 RepID=UPI002F961201
MIKRNVHGYLAGVESESSSVVPEGMFMYIIPSGKYVGATHRGPISKINETFEKLTHWLSVSNYEQYDVVCYEVYDGRFKGRVRKIMANSTCSRGSDRPNNRHYPEWDWLELL